MKSYGGFHLGRKSLLHVHLGDGSMSERELNHADVGKYLGGRGLGSYLLYGKATAGNDPLEGRNPLIFSTDPLTGTLAPGSAKAFVTTKSPLTGIILTSISGGMFGPELKGSGFDVVIIEGKSPIPQYLYIHDGKAELRDAFHLRGLLTSDTQELLKAELKDDKVQIACIGPAGENFVPYAAIIDGRRAFGRGGAGAG